MKKNYFVLLIASVIAISLTSCSKSKSTPSPSNSTSTPTTVTISGMAFPATTTVKKGTVVSWYNYDGVAHTVTSNDGTTFDSGSLDAGSTFSYTANTVGTFPYHCNFHSSMKGTLVVNP